MNEAVEIKVEEPIYPKYAVQCLEEFCSYRWECANHASAGDFRTEDGMKPRLSLRNNKIFCATKRIAYNEQIVHQTIPIEEHGYGCVIGSDLVEESNTYDI